MDENSGMHPIKTVLSKRWPPMSQAQLARRLDMNASVLSRYLNGVGAPPSEGFYIAAAAVLGCEPDELRPTEVAAA